MRIVRIVQNADIVQAGIELPERFAVRSPSLLTSGKHLLGTAGRLRSGGTGRQPLLRSCHPSTGQDARVPPSQTLLDRGEEAGGPGGNRTRDLRIKSPLLCLLSYRPNREGSSHSGLP